MQYVFLTALVEVANELVCSTWTSTSNWQWTGLRPNNSLEWPWRCASLDTAVPQVASHPSYRVAQLNVESLLTTIGWRNEHTTLHPPIHALFLPQTTRGTLYPSFFYLAAFRVNFEDGLRRIRMRYSVTMMSHWVVSFQDDFTSGNYLFHFGSGVPGCWCIAHFNKLLT